MFCSLTAKDGLILVSRQKIAPADFKWDMLKGKTLLSWRAGNTPQVDTDWVLKQHGLDPKKDVDDITNLASGNRDGAWLSGKGDFGTFFEPTVSIIQSKGMGSPLLSIGNEIGPVDFTGFVALDNYLASKPSVVQGWCNAVYKAQKVVASSSPEQLALAAAPYFPQLDRELLISSISRYKELGIWKTDPGIEPAGMAKIQDIMIAGGMLKAAENVEFDRIVTNRFADAAREQVK
jgi:NitT/TauT family transport system substrate-binding protein